MEEKKDKQPIQILAEDHAWLLHIKADTKKPLYQIVADLIRFFREKSQEKMNG